MMDDHGGMGLTKRLVAVATERHCISLEWWKWQTNNTEHMQHPIIYKSISLGTDKEGNLAIRTFICRQWQCSATAKAYCTQQIKWHLNHGKTIINKMEGRDNITPIKQSKEASGRHVSCDYQLACITADNILANMAMMSSLSCIGNEICTRSGWISHRLFRLGIVMW